MSIYISVVSHNHANIISKLGTLEKLSNSHHVVIKNNTDETLNVPGAHILNDNKGLGFGANNNHIFKYCQKIGMKKKDLFLVLNPDIIITENSINELEYLALKNNSKIASINLFLDEKKTISDNSLRLYPTFFNFIKALLFKSKDTIVNKNKANHIEIQWVSGAFILFEADVYAQLGGFDERYFMYCEDIDICYRAKKLKFNIDYYHNIEAIHLARRNNRKIFSRHFYWHVFNAIRFLLIKNNFLKMKKDKITYE